MRLTKPRAVAAQPKQSQQNESNYIKCTVSELRVLGCVALRAIALWLSAGQANKTEGVHCDTRTYSQLTMTIRIKEEELQSLAVLFDCFFSS